MFLDAFYLKIEDLAPGMQDNAHFLVLFTHIHTKRKKYSILCEAHKNQQFPPNICTKKRDFLDKHKQSQKNYNQHLGGKLSTISKNLKQNAHHQVLSRALNRCKTKTPKFAP